MSELVKECHHGRLTRQCRECDMEKEICELQDKLTTITNQRDELQKYLRHIHDYMLVKNKSYREGDLSAEVGTLLSTIKERIK